MEGPGRRGGYPPRLPQIRACALNAPGSSRCGRSLSLTRLGRFAVTRWRGTVSSPIVPTAGPQRGAPSLHGVGRAVPRFNATMEHCDFLCLLAALRFLRLAIPWTRPAFRRRRPQRNHTAFDLAVYASRRRSPARRRKTRFPGGWPGSAGRDWLPAGCQCLFSHREMILGPELLGT